MEWEFQLVGDYIAIESTLQRISPESLSRTPPGQISDTEVLTIYFWGLRTGHRSITTIHRYVRAHLREWFPALPGYQQYVKRINRLADLLESIFGVLCFADESDVDKAVIDSMPIVIASSSRSGRASVAPDLCSKGYCASKKMYYYGCKLHLVVSGDRNSAPYSMLAGDISPASEHDIGYLKRSHLLIKASSLYGDKAYLSNPLAREMFKTDLKLICPPKKPRGKAMSLGSQLIGALISGTRQTIETAFGWIQRKTGISKASNVRSSQGLRRHIFGALVGVALGCA